MINMETVLNLGPRLAKIVEYCDNSKVVADIGCDHGYITAEIVLQNKADMVIASDISPESVNSALKFARSVNILPFISFREGSGFDVITKHDKVETAIIAGMGGNTIISILEGNKQKVKNLILQPMRDEIKLRRYLIENDYKIEEDVIVKDENKFYTVIKAKKGKRKLSELELIFGKTNIERSGDDFYRYLQVEKNKIENVKEKIGELNTNYAEKLEKINEILEYLNE